MNIIEQGSIFKKVDINQKEKVNYVIKEIPREDIRKIIQLQDSVYENINDKHIYVCKSEKDFSTYLNNGGIFLGVYVEDELVAARITDSPGLSKYNLGHTLGFSEEDLLKTMHFKTILVKNEYRGNNLQVRSMKLVEKMFIQRGYTFGLCQISPDNYYSLANAMNFGLQIRKIKLQFKNKKNVTPELRCILSKDLSSVQPITFQEIEYVKNTNIDKQKELLSKNFVGFKAKNFNTINDFTIVYGRTISNNIIIA